MNLLIGDCDLMLIVFQKPRRRHLSDDSLENVYMEDNPILVFYKLNV